jgi:hypothetical protein
MGTGERIWQAQTETETEPGIIAWVFRWRRWSGHALTSFAVVDEAVVAVNRNAGTKVVADWLAVNL